MNYIKNLKHKFSLRKFIKILPNKCFINDTKRILKNYTMALFKKYCKEIIKELDKIPVYLPGTPVSPGDILRFGDYEARGKPIGSFVHYTSLSKYDIRFDIQEDNDPDPYLYSSKNSVGVKFTADANATTNIGGKLDVTFSREGATYFAAIDCTLQSIKDLSSIESQLNLAKTDPKIGGCYLVVSVTTAKKALIMQSNSRSASLTLDGNVQGLQPSTGTKVDASLKVNISSYKDSSFIKPWSDNVTVFFSLGYLSKNDDGKLDVSLRSILPGKYSLTKVDLKELLRNYPR
jgi:hypothetical protein